MKWYISSFLSLRGNPVGGKTSKVTLNLFEVENWPLNLERDLSLKKTQLLKVTVV